MLANWNSFFFFGKQRTKGNFYSYAICFCVCVCVNIHVCHTQTFTYVYVWGKITIFISDGPRHRLLPTLRIVCAGSLSKANSEIKAHKFILANCWNKRKQASGQWVREPTRYLFIFVSLSLRLLTELLAWLSETQNAAHTHLSCGDCQQIVSSLKCFSLSSATLHFNFLYTYPPPFPGLLQLPLAIVIQSVDFNLIAAVCCWPYFMGSGLMKFV